MALPLQKFQYKDAGYLFLWGFLAIQAVGFVLSLLPKVISGNLMIMGVLNNLALLGVYFIYAKARNTAPFRASGLTAKFTPWAILLAVALAPLLQILLGSGMELFNRLLQLGGYSSANRLVNLTFLEYGIGGLVGYILISGVMTGFCEELLFRGGILQSLRARLGDTAAIFISAACFMLFHASPDQTVFQFGLGLLLGYLTVRTGSVVPAMIVHITNNVLSVLMTAFWLPEGWGKFIEGWGMLVGCAVTGIILAAALLPLLIDVVTGKTKSNFMVALFVRRSKTETTEATLVCKVDSNQEPTEDEDIVAMNERTVQKMENKAGTVLLWVGAAICIALWIAQLVMGFVTEAI